MQLQIFIWHFAVFSCSFWNISSWDGTCLIFMHYVRYDINTPSSHISEFHLLYILLLFFTFSAEILGGSNFYENVEIISSVSLKKLNFDYCWCVFYYTLKSLDYFCSKKIFCIFFKQLTPLFRRFYRWKVFEYLKRRKHLSVFLLTVLETCFI